MIVRNWHKAGRASRAKETPLDETSVATDCGTVSLNFRSFPGYWLTVEMKPEEALDLAERLRSFAAEAKNRRTS